MSLIVWIMLGLIAGFVASRVVDRRGGDLVDDLPLGIIGAVVAGALFHCLQERSGAGLNLWSFLVAFVGSVAVLAAHHAIADRDPA